MIKKIKHILRYIKYFFSASHRRGFGIHSPFVFQFINNILLADKIHEQKPILFNALKKIKKDKRPILYLEKGAGSIHRKRGHKTTKQIKKHHCIKHKYGKVLNRIVYFYNIKNILELGTSIGVSTLYMSTVNPGILTDTIDGNKTCIEYANNLFKSYNLKNIETHYGDFNNLLPGLLNKKSYDLVFIDGNHTYESTMEYFNLLLEKSRQQSILIFDDIHWSEGMEAAWHKIISHPLCTVTIDIFQFGIVFLNPDLSKQHFIIRY